VSFIFKKKAVRVTLGISPPRFQVESQKRLAPNAILSPAKAPSGLITWSLEGPGMLSTTVGPSTKYEAPSVKEETEVRILAVFRDSKEYLDNIAHVRGTILPPGRVAKAAAVFVMSPPSFSIRSEATTELNSNLRDTEGNILAMGVKWQIFRFS